MPTLRPLFSAAQRSRTRAVNGFGMQSKDKTGGSPGGAGTGATMTSGTIAVGIGTTIRGSWRPVFAPAPTDTYTNTNTLAPPPATNSIRGSWKPPVPPKSPSYAGSNFGSNPSSSPTYYQPTSNGSSPTAHAYHNPQFDTAPLFSGAKGGAGYGKTAFESDLERAGGMPKRLALLRRDENGIFRPEAVYRQ